MDYNVNNLQALCKHTDSFVSISGLLKGNMNSAFED